ncbi:MAG TPA: type IV pilus secretin PilQ [Nitrospiria bacterium]|jgi:type IV pilus assembly protein PilQ|nr:type IV pilus secretin PilQ [Nitrospiria bacterium]
MRNKNKMHYSISLVISPLILLGLFACAPKAVPIKPVPQESQEIKDIQVVDLSEKTQIIVETEQPMVYTSFRLTDPLRLVLDLAGTTAGKYHEPIAVNSGAVTYITPVEGVPPSTVVRLEIGLSEAVTTEVVTSGTKLIVDVMKPSSEVSAAPASPETSAPAPATPSTEMATEKPKEAAAEPKPALVVTQVKADISNGSVKVIITGDGALKPEVQELSGNRLVVDLPGTTNLMKPNIIQVKHALLKRIRIGQHLKPKKVRVVLDLRRKASYTVEKDNNQVVVALGEASAGAHPSSPTQNETLAEGEPTKPKEQAPKEEAATGQIEKASESSPKLTEPAPVTPSEEKKDAALTPVVVKRDETVSLKRYVGRKISLDFQDAEITNVLRLIADVSGFNIVVGDDVKGKVTVKLINVPWDQALEILLKMNNLGQVREGNIIRIATLANITRQDDEETKAKEAKSRSEELVTKVIYMNYAKAKELADPLKKNLSPRGDITTDDRTNTMILKDISRNVVIISDLVKTLDTPTPQVLIEARIIEATTSFARALGVQWGATFTNFNKNGVLGVSGQSFGTGSGGAPTVAPFGNPPPTFAVNLPAGSIAAAGLSSFGGLGFTFGKFTGSPFNLDLRLSAGENQGLSKTISAPKITALDNQEARIEQGESIPFSSTSAQGTQTIFVDANLTLQVTPHVTSDGSIAMKVKVANNSPDFSTSNPAGPPISKKEANTNILIKDGDTAVIGGIVVNTKADTTQGIPWFEKIPGLGWLFKTNTVSDQTTELLVFLTPRIIK